MWLLNAITSLSSSQLKELSDPSHCCGMTPGGASQGVASFAAFMGTATAIGSMILLLVCMAGLGSPMKFDASRKK
jgi:hypothetical protein